MKLIRLLVVLTAGASCGLILSVDADGRAISAATTVASIHPSRDLGRWEGWGCSLAWWARAVGGTGNADDYSDPHLHNQVGWPLPRPGAEYCPLQPRWGRVNQPQENKGPKLQWQMDIRGYWVGPNSTNRRTGTGPPI